VANLETSTRLFVEVLIQGSALSQKKSVSEKMQCLQRRFLTSSRHNTWRFTRRLHSAKELGYPIANGVGDFLTPEGLKVLAQDYQNGLLDRLNDEVRS
jgi:hypothetical protein